MAGTLTLSSKASPFPWAAAAIATYTQKAELSFDETASGITLDNAGTKLSTEAEIVQEIAKAGGLSDGSTQVSLYPDLITTLVDLIYMVRRRHSLLLQRLFLQQPMSRGS